MAAGLSVPAAQADRMVPVVAPTAATARVADGGNRRQRLVHRGEHRHLPSPCNHVRAAAASPVARAAAAAAAAALSLAVLLVL